MEMSFVKSRLNVHASRLGLEDWSIHLHLVFALHPDLFDPTSSQYATGCTYFDPDTRDAQIYLDSDEAHHIFGWEFTLVHELLHLVINPTLEQMGEGGIEYLINRLAKALLGFHGHEWEVSE